MRIVAVVLAGGSGQRYGADVPKQLLRLAGRTLIEHCVAAFDQAPAVDEILVVMPPGRTAEAEKLLAAGGWADGGEGGDGGDGGGYRKLAGVIEGGVTRPDSTRRALAAINTRIRANEAQPNGAAPGWGVLLHDAARPLVDQQIIAGCVAALEDADAVGVAVPTSDTIVVASDGVMTTMPKRDSLFRCQTPQAFRLPVITRAHELALADPDFAPTDDCGVVLRYLPEIPVRLVPGSEHNIKITYPRDLAIAETLLKGTFGP